jgi:hypothetical protein
VAGGEALDPLVADPPAIGAIEAGSLEGAGGLAEGLVAGGLVFRPAPPEEASAEGAESTVAGAVSNTAAATAAT